jgi:hypothetical protein
MARELIVAGFHRSGTSMTTQLLHRAGLFVGDELIGAVPSNPYGHFEDREFMRLHEAILADNGRNWQVGTPFVPRISRPRWLSAQRLVHRRRLHHRVWGFKDPRTCLFMEMWRHLMPGARVLIVFRSAVDSAYSLERRHTTQYFAREGPAENHLRYFKEPDLALRMWIVHNRALLRFARAHPDDVLAISFETLARGYPLVSLLEERWSLGLEPTPTMQVFDPTVTRSRSYPMAVADPAMVEAAMSIWEELRSLEARSLSEPAVDDAA